MNHSFQASTSYVCPWNTGVFVQFHRVKETFPAEIATLTTFPSSIFQRWHPVLRSAASRRRFSSKRSVTPGILEKGRATTADGIIELTSIIRPRFFFHLKLRERMSACTQRGWESNIRIRSLCRSWNMIAIHPFLYWYSNFSWAILHDIRHVDQLYSLQRL